MENLERLKVDYDTVVFVHEPDRRVTKADLLKIAAEGN
jgi:aryl-alcohol dehydrogenase-like predicted oxidoreductase